MHTRPGNPGISWKMELVLEYLGMSWNFGFMALNILENSTLLETKDNDWTLCQCLRIMDLTFATVSSTHVQILHVQSVKYSD